jgi:hypothetical protein
MSITPKILKKAIPYMHFPCANYLELIGFEFKDNWLKLTFSWDVFAQNIIQQILWHSI